MKGLDRYLTSEPEDYFTPFFEAVCELINDSFFEQNEDWILYDKECENFIFEAYKKGLSPENIAPLIPYFFELKTSNDKQINY
jgi:hypothetical protein